MSKEKEHSEFGGSQAERILNCQASVVLSRGIPNVETPAAKRGTLAHECLEYFVVNRKLLSKPETRKKVLKKADDNKNWDADMISNALHALSYIEDQMGPGATLWAEQELDSTPFTTKGLKAKKQKSTLDVCVANWRARELIVMDYKYGKHPVKVKWNAQLIYYALAMLIKLKGLSKFDRVRLVIIQPNAPIGGKTEREWTVEISKVFSWGKRFRKAVKIALGKNPPFKYGEKYCYFCLAKKKCPVMKLRAAQKDFA